MYGGIDSVQTVKKNIRGFICEGMTSDIDMVNAHPSILLQLCKLHDIECANLFYYNKERKKILNQICEDDHITYEDAKRKVLIATNQNKKITTNNKFLKQYSKEILNIQKRLLDIDDFNYVKEYAKTDGNFEGSFMNHILCIWENEILQVVIDYCKNNEIEIHSLMFDGLMIYGSITDATLINIEKYIASKSDFDNIKLCIKEHEHNFEMPADYQPVKVETYQDVKDKFEINNCKVGCQFVHVNGDVVDVYKKSNFTILHETMTYREDAGADEKRFIDAWYYDKKIKVYSKFGIHPKPNYLPDDVYNLWIPFAVTKYPEPNQYSCKCAAALNYFIHHIKILCNHEQKVYEFVFMWIAQMLQYPENKSIELIFLSVEGVGKGMFLKFFETILGEAKVLETADPKNHVFGQFNGAMKDAYLVCFNEASRAGFSAENDKKKALITDGKIRINDKGISSFEIPSFHRFITFSNTPELQKNNRRDIFINCSAEKIYDAEYFKEGWEYAKDIECCKYIYNYFMNYECKPGISRGDIPETEYDREIVEMQREPVLEFLEDYVCKLIDDTRVPIQTFYEMYLQYCTDYSVLYPMNKIAFGMKIKFLKLRGIQKIQKWESGRNIRLYEISKNMLMESLDLGKEGKGA